MSAPAQLKAGDPAPDFTLPDADGRPVSLKDFRGRRVIVYFYPAAMTPGCTTQACDFRDNLSELDGAGVTVLGISPDPVAKLARFRDEQGLTFPLLSDAGKTTLSAYGAYGEKKLYGKTVIGGDPLDLRDRARRHAGGCAVQREGDRACGESCARSCRSSSQYSKLAVPRRGRSPMAEARGLGPRQCEFDSRRPYTSSTTVRFLQGLQASFRYLFKCLHSLPYCPTLRAVEPLVEAVGLTKRYPARDRHSEPFTAVDGIDLTLHRGELFGFLGPNGAGKILDDADAGVRIPRHERHAAGARDGSCDQRPEDPLAARRRSARTMRSTPSSVSWRTCRSMAVTSECPSRRSRSDRLSYCNSPSSPTAPVNVLMHCRVA